MMEAWQRTAMVLGEAALDVLAEKHVAVFGLGGVGSFCAEALARSGIGALTLVDDDIVAQTNLNRQLVALHSTLGRPKAEVMASRIRDINPHCRLRVLQLRYTPEARETFFDQHLDYIADCIDNVTAKCALITSALKSEKYIFSSMGTGNKLDISKYRIADISQTNTCPLARAVRKVLKQNGITSGVDVLFSTEIPPKAETRTPASICYMPAAAGIIIAEHIIKRIIG